MTAPAPTPERDPEDQDLGFGRFVSQAVRGRFFEKDGSPTGHKYGLGAQRAERFYLKALAAPWPGFIGSLVAVLLLINGIFAVGYRALGPGALQGTDEKGLSDPFLRALAFSVGVFTTTGTEGVRAVGATANWLVILESIAGVLFFVGVSGLLIARLTRPRMRLHFSESAIVAPYEGGRGLMFRMTNAQLGELSDVRVKFSLIWYEMIDGKRERNFHALDLERDSVEFFTLHWTVVHPITVDSPLRGATPELLREAQAEFVVSVNGHDEVFSTRVRSRTSYTWDELRWDVKFASIFAESPDGAISIDVERLSRTEPVPEGTTSRPAALEAPTSTPLRAL
jgi:inward rectifier potassium channel